MRLSEVDTPRSISSVNDFWPPNTVSVRNREMNVRPLGTSRRSVRRVPPSAVGSSSNTHTVVFSVIRLANRRPGSHSTTRLGVGQIIGSRLLMFSAHVPLVVRPPRAKIFHAWLLHCVALRTSETTSQTRAGGASISIEFSMERTEVESVVMDGPFGRGAGIDSVLMVGQGY